MKITRRQLRRLIETRIKPSIPNVPSEELLGRIDDFARDPEMQQDADVFAGSFGYPEDRSYVKDLKTYDVAGREIFTDVYLKPFGDDEDEVTIVIPMDLIDNIIEAHEDLEETESMKPSGSGYHFHRLYQSHQTKLYAARNKLRDAGMDIYRHIHDQLDGRYGRDNYDIYDYGYARGYRSEEFNKAMEKFGGVY